jgi:hypothetical protein
MHDDARVHRASRPLASHSSREVISSIRRPPIGAAEHRAREAPRRVRPTRARPTRLSLATSRHHTLGASLRTRWCRALDADSIRLTRVCRYRTLYGTTDAELRTVHSDLLAKHAQLLGACAADPLLLRRAALNTAHAPVSTPHSLAYCSQYCAARPSRVLK